MLRGVDIAGSYQAGFDVARAKAEDGVAFCAFKISEGSSTGASWDTNNWAWAQRWTAQCRQVGVIPGGYHFLRAGDGAAQARLFHDRITQLGGPGGWLIQLDCESDGYAAPMSAFVAQWLDLTGGHPLTVYSGAWWWPKTGGFNGASLTPYLWHSHYLWDSATNDARSGTFAQLEGQVPSTWWTPGYGGWGRATILQFTSRGTCGGLTSNVDLNLFGGDRAALAALTGATMEGDSELTTLGALVWNGAWMTQRLAENADPVLIPANAEVSAPGASFPNALAQKLADIEGKVDALATGGVDVDQLAAKVAGLLRLPTAAEVAEELARRLANG